MIHANRTIQKILLSCCFTLGFVAFMKPSQPAYACSTCEVYQNALAQEFQTHESWMNNEWWNQYVQPALKSAADQNRNVSELETVVYGAFLDAQNLMTSQRALQELTSNTLKNYTPSDTICKFGTLSRSLALSESKANANQLFLSKRSMNRQLGQFNTASALGEEADRQARLKQFQTDFCDAKDFGSGMKVMCSGTPSDKRLNNDINFTRTIDGKSSLNVDFTDATVTDDEKDVLALASNLYAHKVFNRIDSGSLNKAESKDEQSTYLDQRAIVAKRSVAENTFNELVGQKSAGGKESQVYLAKVLEALGLSNATAVKELTEAPSYDAQMEILTKKLYQDPAFYASLMDSPANVNRQYAALQSFGLMQKRDIFESVSRSEILMSLLLEMEIGKYQDDIQNRQNN